MTESDEYRFLPGRFCLGGVWGGGKFEIVICRLLGCLEAGSKVQKTLIYSKKLLWVSLC